MTLGSSGDDIALVGSSNDLDIRCGLVATDALNLQAYDVGAGAYEDMVTLASHATLPTMVLHATGGTTINAGLTLSDAAGTGAAVIGGVAGQNMTNFRLTTSAQGPTRTSLRQLPTRLCQR